MSHLLEEEFSNHSNTNGFLFTPIITLFTIVLFGFTGTVHHELIIRAETETGKFFVSDDISIGEKLLHNKSKITLRLPSTIKSLQVSWKQQKPEGATLSIKRDSPGFGRVHIKNLSGTNWSNPIQLSFKYNFKVTIPDEPGKKEGYFLEDFLPRTLQGKYESASLATFKMTTDVPKKWKTVSQGERLEELILNERRIAIWDSPEPQQEIYLALDKFIEYRKTTGGINMYAFLRQEDQPLAERYLNSSGPYIEFYQKLLMPYPYKKFALVENLHSTGYGMPSFTLLGSKVIRFPFIMKSSWPHEILHNWWGNSVYTDPNSGNWAEGLTTYLADHLMKELKGEGDHFRFQQLIKYLNFVRKSTDFPLASFKSSYDMVSQAVGYGKTLMMFHMLRRHLGDKIFIKALQVFFTNFKFRLARLEDLRHTFESISGKDLLPFFHQWTERAGAPEIGLSNVSTAPFEDGYKLYLTVNQKEPFFEFNLPIGIWSSDGNLKLKFISISQTSNNVSLKLNHKPGKIELDPYYDLFRKLDTKDVPPTVSQTYGAEKVTILPQYALPSYEEFARGLEKSKENFTLAKSELDIPPDTPLLFVGKNETLIKSLQKQLKKYSVKISKSGVLLEEKHFNWENHGFVFALRHPKSYTRSLLWIVPGPSQSFSGLIRKLPHYGKFSYMVFKGLEPQNKIRGTWPTVETSLSRTFQPGLYPLPRQKPLVDFQPNLP